MDESTRLFLKSLSTITLISVLRVILKERYLKYWNVVDLYQDKEYLQLVEYDRQISSMIAER